MISTHNIDALNFLGAPSVNTAFFEPTTPDEVYSAFISLKNSKARDIDGLQIKPIKFAIYSLVPLLPTYSMLACLLAFSLQKCNRQRLLLR